MPGLVFSSHVSLQAFTTFGLPAYAAHYAVIEHLDDLRQAWQNPQVQAPLLILGGGSNLLLTQDWPGTVLHNRLMGHSVVKETETEVFWQVASGENWHQTVQKAVAQGWGGLENLSLIPGTVGAAPIQNIGAYGVELKDIFDSLQAFDWQTGEVHTFSVEQCRFGYRESIFKQEAKGRYFILSVTFRLQKNPEVVTHYGAIQTVLNEKGITQPGIADVSQAVIEIRQSKLPDPAQIGNAGSFFKNPEIPAEQFAKLQTRYPNIPSFPAGHGQVKVPAGWLIEQAGWKGHTRNGTHGVHKWQALVLVNYGGATGAEIVQLAQDVMDSVQATFGIRLTPEVNIWPPLA